MKKSHSLYGNFLTISLLVCNLSFGQEHCPPIVFNGSLGPGDTTLPTNTRWARFGSPPSCAAPKSFPGTFDFPGPHYYDTYTLTNTTGSIACVSVTFTNNQEPGNLLPVIYLNSFDPSNLATNYLADWGGSLTSGIGSLSFNLASGAAVVIVAAAVDGIESASYTISVEGTTTCNSIATSTLPSDFCEGSSVQVGYTANGTFNAGNTFTAQLSNSIGDFTNATDIGSVSATESGTINAVIPTGTTTGTGYRIRVISGDPAITGANNGADIIINARTTFYHDADGDGYGNAASTTTSCSSTPPTGYVSNNKDCNDNDPAISPTAVEVCGNKVDDNCNGTVDENTCFLCKNATNLSTTSITSGSAVLNWQTNANPQQWQLEYKTIATGSKWVDVFLTGNIRSVKITGLFAKQSYNWHVRAKCNGKWTGYSNSVRFTTAGSAIASSSTQQSIAAKQSNEENPGIKLYPNPTRGQFAIELHLVNKINTNTKIELVNMMGQTVSVENANISNGLLQKTVSVSSSLTPGIYIVKVVVNDKTYLSKLIYENKI